jgi:hypothetical protein
MKLVGFIKEHENIEEALSFIDIINESFVNQEGTLKRIIEYLNKGSLVIGMMGFFTDFKTGEKSVTAGYYTDGVWLWPNYFPYYINKYPDIYINNDFLEYLQKQDFKLENKGNILEKATQFERLLTELFIKKGITKVEKASDKDYYDRLKAGLVQPWLDDSIS